MEVFDHCPIVVSISTSIPKAFIFRFENFWLQREDFTEILTSNWIAPNSITDKAMIITRNCKNLRGALKTWSSNFSNLKATIANINLVLQFIDFLEEFRDLSLDEWNFRATLREKLLSLLEQQRIYWKQRAAIKWATLGDAGTKFFHANATLRHRNNTIASLKDDRGVLVHSHAEKENLIWNSFRIRLGQTEFQHMLFDLSPLIQRHENLETLEARFTTDEIDSVVRLLPNNKSPGPDGFTNEFIKKCWPHMKMIFITSAGLFRRTIFASRALTPLS